MTYSRTVFAGAKKKQRVYDTVFGQTTVKFVFRFHPNKFRRKKYEAQSDDRDTENLSITEIKS